MLFESKQKVHAKRGSSMTQPCNNVVTQNCNAIQCKTQKQQEFLNRALKINTEQQRPFHFRDFPDYSQENFRQMIHKLRDKIVLLYRSPLGFYKVIGVSLPEDRKCVTYEGTRVGLSMIPILTMLKEQPPAIHDIKLKFESSILHETLKNLGNTMNPDNHCIKLQHYYLQDYLFAKMQVYPNTVQVDIGCSSKPIIYDIGGAISLSIHLGRLYHYLSQLINKKPDFPLPNKWIITHYHFGKDGREELAGPRFERTIEDAIGGIIRFYSKTMPDGRTLPRVETIATPHRTLDEEILLMIKEEM